MPLEWRRRRRQDVGKPAMEAANQETPGGAVPAAGQPSGGGGWDPEAVDLTACMAGDADDQPFTVEDFLQSRPSRLRVEIAFHSRLPRSYGPAGVTATLTASAQKLRLLKVRLFRWQTCALAN